MEEGLWWRRGLCCRRRRVRWAGRGEGGYTDCVGVGEGVGVGVGLCSGLSSGLSLSLDWGLNIRKADMHDGAPENNTESVMSVTKIQVSEPLSEKAPTFRSVRTAETKERK